MLFITQQTRALLSHLVFNHVSENRLMLWYVIIAEKNESMYADTSNKYYKSIKCIGVRLITAKHAHLLINIIRCSWSELLINFRSVQIICPMLSDPLVWINIISSYQTLSLRE